MWTYRGVQIHWVAEKWHELIGVIHNYISSLCQCMEDRFKPNKLLEAFDDALDPATWPTLMERESQTQHL